jgi:hypothetical protein
MYACGSRNPTLPAWKERELGREKKPDHDISTSVIPSTTVTPVRFNGIEVFIDVDPITSDDPIKRADNIKI